jgi:predicted transport protein
MSASSKVEIIFQGAKCFWRTRNTVDLMIIHHVGLNVLEVVTYEPSFDKEAPRLYLDNAVLESKIDQSEVEEKLRAAKEPILRRHEVPNAEKLLKEIVTNTKVAYVLNRLFITEFSVENKVIKVELQFNFRDHDDAHNTGTDVSAVTCQRPPDLVQYKSPHYHTLL